MAKTLEQGFENLIRWLKPSFSEHEKAISHKSSVESCLRNNFGCYNFFKTGSFGNGTGVRHFSDTDYFAVCPTEKLLQNSSNTLRKVKESLQRTFWKTRGIIVSSPAVKIPFGRYASEDLEITPCDFQGMIETPFGKKATYEISDSDGGWMYSSPDAHNTYVSKHDKRLDGKLKPLIQLLKAWKYYNNVPISSFYLELRVTKYAENENSIIYEIDLERILKKLYENELAHIQDPMKISGYIKACKTELKRDEAFSKLTTAYNRTIKANHFTVSNLDKSFLYWKLLFNGRFPSR